MTLPVGEIDERISQPVSLMPENLTATLSEQNLVDLVVYLQSLTKPTFTVTNWHALGPLSDTVSLSITTPIDLNARHVGKNKQSLQWQTIHSDREGKIALLKNQTQSFVSVLCQPIVPLSVWPEVFEFEFLKNPCLPHRVPTVH